MKQRQKNMLFLIVCLGLGILAELSFFHGMIGISYPIFIAAFYAVFYFRFGFTFNHRRIGLLLMVVIWVLSASYLFYDNETFYLLNIIVIPILVFIHIVLITTPNKVDWISIPFFNQVMNKFSQMFSYVKRYIKLMGKRTLFKQMKKETTQAIKRIIYGLLIGIPLLLFITALLMLADEKFGNVVMTVPNFITKFNFLEGFFRLLVVVIATLLFFGAFQVLKKKYTPIIVKPILDKKQASWDGITAATILVLLNSVYLLFVVIQFKYFFGNAIQENFTYAEYARRGFFELILVTLINWTLLLCFLKFVKPAKKALAYFIKVMYSLLIVSSGIMLASAYMRLTLYEEAYGFTIDRILAHTFMLFLLVIFAYTLIRVWLEGISLLHFYMIAGLIFYTGLNAINLEEMIVENNLERYEQTGKIDIYYLNGLSFSGIDGLITLYEKDPYYPELRMLLREQKEILHEIESNTWQSYNFKRQQVMERLRGLELK
ncbi:DUF4153 domain-containing protein [Ornithinibacillus bavariensis]|uniref:DUF4153 domain-containing protein n=1 Tax=Ornithinibacillus bavariensis TaxID=545502 RepID=UPI000ECE60D5|nr:hypothetical protein [Ornithinibacillus sp.]